MYTVIDDRRTEPERTLSAWVGRIMRSNCMVAQEDRQVGTAVAYGRQNGDGDTVYPLISTALDTQQQATIIPYLVPAHPTQRVRMIVSGSVIGDCRIRAVDIAGGAVGDWLDIDGTGEWTVDVGVGSAESSTGFRAVGLQIQSVLSGVEDSSATWSLASGDSVRVGTSVIDPTDPATPCVLVDDAGRALCMVTDATMHSSHSYDLTLWPMQSAENVFVDPSGSYRTDITIAVVGALRLFSVFVWCEDDRPMDDDIDPSGTLPPSGAIVSGALVTAAQVAGLQQCAQHVYVTRPRWLTADPCARAPLDATWTVADGTGIVGTLVRGGDPVVVGSGAAYTVRENCTGLRISGIFAPAPDWSEQGTLSVAWALAADTLTGGAISVDLPTWDDVDPALRPTLAQDRVWQCLSDSSVIWRGADISATPGQYPRFVSRDLILPLPAGFTVGAFSIVALQVSGWRGAVLALSIAEIVEVTTL